MWENAIKKEVLKVKVVFEPIEHDKGPLPGSKLINYHIIFDLKYELSRKARLMVVT